jgi:hypothetical protein
MTTQFVQAEVLPGAWKLPDNEVWNIPEGGEERFDIKTTGYGWNLVTDIRGLACTLDGRIFGYRNMHHPKESGYQMEGKVSIGGKKVRAFTSSRLFERPDGSLIDVAILVVCLPDREEDDVHGEKCQVVPGSVCDLTALSGCSVREARG